MAWSYSLARPPDGEPEALTELLGGKGANLTIMANDLGLPVPPGFVISTEACKAYLESGWPDDLDAEIRQQMALLEQSTGRAFGDPDDPLLVSVRSGAPVSMPGMLDTILNLGLNDAATDGLARITGDASFAAACRRRLETMYREIVGPVELDQDPWRQLRAAIEAVFRSWESDRARRYRDREGIASGLGTGAVVQAMVFGNRDDDSATGVLFTRNPATGENVLYGDVLFSAQGEDVVGGAHATEPIDVLDERLPEVAEQLRRHARELERHFADLCDIEFTIEAGKLWLLQTRVGKRSARAALRMAIEMAQDDSFPLSRTQAVQRVASILADPPMTVLPDHEGDLPIVAVGLPASPGLAVGAIATTTESALAMVDAGRAVILVRPETSPNDVPGMARAAGVLTATGGLASHAAVVARGWDIPAVVGARDVVVEHRRISIGARIWREGDEISIDGSTGDVYGEAIDSAASVAPEAAVLLRWASQEGIDVHATAAHDDAGEEPDGGRVPDDGGAGDADALLGLVSIKGYVTAELAGAALDVPEAAAAALLETALEESAVSVRDGTFSLSAAGRDRAAALLATDRERWGAERAAAALDEFIPLDVRVKATVTAWQMREVNGEQVLNDHSDRAYDAAVLADLEAVHTDARAWLDPLVARLPRLRSYRRRLDAAMALVAGGDARFMASPRVDSYHSVWFELHEDLIRLAGRTREDEVAADRA